MKLITSWLFIFFITTGIGGCATNNTPDTSGISSLPIIELGQKKSNSNEYILLLRAGVNIPVTVSISGSMLSKESKTNITVQLKRDIYLYKKWTSLDGEKWTEKNINLLIATGLDTSGGTVNITVDEIAK